MSRNAKGSGRRIAIIAAAIALVLTMSACGLNSGSGGPAGSGDDSNEVLIGVALPYTGAVSRTGKLYRNGVELAVKQAEESGELGDLRLKVDYQDDANNPNEAVTLVTRYDQAGAVAMIGAHSSPVALAQAKAVEAVKMPEFVFGASDAIDNPYQYQANARDSEQVANIIPFAEAKKFDTVALMTDTGSYGTNALEQLQAVLGKSDLKIVGSETFEPTASNLTPQLVSLRANNPDFIAMFSFGTPYAAVVKGKAEIGWDVPIVGNIGAGDVAIAEIAGKDATGLYFQTPMGGQSSAAQALAKAWAAEYPKTPLTFEGAMGYDVMTVLIRALKDGATTREAVQDWLENADNVEGLASGTSAWDLTNRKPIEAEDLFFKMWENGKTVDADLSR